MDVLKEICLEKLCSWNKNWNFQVRYSDSILNNFKLKYCNFLKIRSLVSAEGVAHEREIKILKNWEWISLIHSGSRDSNVQVQEVNSGIGLDSKWQILENLLRKKRGDSTRWVEESKEVKMWVCRGFVWCRKSRSVSGLWSLLMESSLFIFLMYGNGSFVCLSERGCHQVRNLNRKLVKAVLTKKPWSFYPAISLLVPRCCSRQDWFDLVLQSASLCCCLLN